jgi:hypothetical protein
MATQLVQNRIPRFVQIGNTLIALDYIRRIDPISGGADTQITLDDGTTELVGIPAQDVLDFLNRKHLILTP